MRDRAIETLVGLFVLAGIICLVVLALKVSGLGTIVGTNGYVVTASFDNVGGLKARSPVTIAGVRVGEVKSIQLDQTTFRAVVSMQIDPTQNKLPTDTSASIFTQGLLGSNYISLTPGFDNTYLKNGGIIENTHPALILENMIGQLLFSVKNNASSSTKK